MANQSSSKPNLVFIVAIIMVIGIIVALQKQTSRKTDGSGALVGREDSSEDSGNRTGFRSVANNGDDDRGSQNSRLNQGTSGRDANTTTGEETPPEPEENAKNADLVHNFRNYEKSLEGYKLEGVEQTAEGITLPPAVRDPNTSEVAVRIGTLESPSTPLTFPSNMVAPVWRNKLPDGTSMNVEVSMSADDSEWTQWFPVEPTGDEIAPTYPDGRPNPNYGAVGGTPIGMGLALYPFVKYRVTLTAGNENNPLLQEVRLFHTDSTGPGGYMANNPPPDPGPTTPPPPASTDVPPPPVLTPGAGPSPDASQPPPPAP